MYVVTVNMSLHTNKAYSLFRVRVFGDLRVSSEDIIVTIIDVITAVLLNIFGLLGKLLKARNPLPIRKVSEQRQHNTVILFSSIFFFCYSTAHLRCRLPHCSGF